MSPRAAWRLESLGFTKVYDYVAGKVDWNAGGLPMEGKQADYPRAGDIARADAPTCRLSDRIAQVRDRVKASGHKVCVVTNDEGIVLGRLDSRALTADPGATVEAVMQSGPTTTRPDDPLEAVASRLRDARVGSIIVTTPEGRLMGVLHREDAERFLAK